MPTQFKPKSEVGGQRSEWTARSDPPARSVFGNYRPGAAPDSDPARLPDDMQRPRSETGAPLQASIDLAIARSFIYRFVAKVFEDPTPESWAALTETTTQASFRVALGAGSDGNSALLAAGEALLAALRPEQFEAFQSECVGSFGHAARGGCPQNEIEYGDIKADPLFQPHRLADLAAFYRAFGLELTPDASERHDHICIELEFMSVLTAKEAYALEHQLDPEQLAVCRAAQKNFLREHLGRWVPAFARRLLDGVGEGALWMLANFTRAFIEAECARLGVPPGGEDLLLRPVDEAAERMCESCGLANGLPGALAATEA